MMATVGQQLTAPESGWKRIDDLDNNIVYSGTGWERWLDSGMYQGGAYRNTNANSKVDLVFNSTKIRIISAKNNDLSSNIEIKLDGVVVENINTVSSKILQCLVYEITGLEKKPHTLTMTNISGGFMYLDAIDIDDNGHLGYLNKFLILSNDKTYSIENAQVYKSIPILTSNTSSSPIVVSGSLNSGAVWQVFDGNKATKWQPSGSSYTTKGWIKVDFGAGNEKRIFKYSIYAERAGRQPSSWNLEASNTGEFLGEHVILDTRTGQNTNVETEYTFSNDNKFRYYRLNITSTGGGDTSTYLEVGELNFYDYTNPTLTVTDFSEQNFINHGIDKSTEIDLSAEMTNKIFIEQSSTTLGSGKVFKKVIDTTATPIKSVSIE